ncbi:predicted protein [Postia placenta Mad-698-R]|nr:predicted protein [Postia placenta Mad-698-R]
MTIQRPKEDLPPFDHASASTYTEPPNAGWTLAQPLSATPEGRAWLAGEKQGWEVVHADDADPYRIMGDITYARVGGLFRAPRPEWADAERVLLAASSSAAVDVREDAPAADADAESSS